MKLICESTKQWHGLAESGHPWEKGLKIQTCIKMRNQSLCSVILPWAGELCTGQWIVAVQAAANVAVVVLRNCFNDLLPAFLPAAVRDAVQACIPRLCPSKRAWLCLKKVCFLFSSVCRPWRELSWLYQKEFDTRMPWHEQKHFPSPQVK